MAGVTAAEELLRLVPRGAVRITIITAGSMLKEVRHFPFQSHDIHFLGRDREVYMSPLPWYRSTALQGRFPRMTLPTITCLPTCLNPH